MTNIDKSNISLSKAAVVLVFCCATIITYYTTKSASEAGVNNALNDIYIQLNNLQNEDKLIWKQTDQNSYTISELKQSINTYMGKAIMPKEPTTDREGRRKHN